MGIHVDLCVDRQPAAPLIRLITLSGWNETALCVMLFSHMLFLRADGMIRPGINKFATIYFGGKYAA